MKSMQESAKLIEKERVRAQISDHIEAFLRSGGKIDVLNSNGNNLRSAIGTAWSEEQYVDRFAD